MEFRTLTPIRIGDVVYINHKPIVVKDEHSSESQMYLGNNDCLETSMECMGNFLKARLMMQEASYADDAHACCNHCHVDEQMPTSCADINDTCDCSMPNSDILDINPSEPIEPPTESLNEIDDCDCSLPDFGEPDIDPIPPAEPDELPEYFEDNEEDESSDYLTDIKSLDDALIKCGYEISDI